MHHAEKLDGGRKFLPHPDLIAGWQIAAALQRRLEPLDRITDGFRRDVVGWMRDRWLVQFARSPIRNRSVQLADLHRISRAELQFHFRTGRCVPRTRRAPHQRAELIAPGIHEPEVTRERDGAGDAAVRAGRRTFGNHRGIVVRKSLRGDHRCSTAHRVPFQPDVVLVYDGERTDVLQAILYHRGQGIFGS